MRIVIREAVPADVEQIVAVDDSRYAGITSQYASSLEDMFLKRIENSYGWFWVAEVNGRIEGLLSCLPVASSPESFISWDECTADGTLEGKYDPASDVVYVVALTTTPIGTKLDVADLLLATGLAKAVRSRMRLAFFSGRLPGYHSFARTMTALDYYNATVEIGGKLRAMDAQVRHFESLGLKRVRLVEGGFPEDDESCGYGVLFKMDIPCQHWPCPALWSSIIGGLARRPRLFALVAKLA